MLYPIESKTREISEFRSPWYLKYDPQHQGQKEEYFLKQPEGCEEIALCASINEQINGRDKYLYMDWLWYFTEFKISPL
ncbi:MAG: hypothetical protein PF447_10700, partial [Spirochaetaceae bacterium]|nr:hypothetical protein [Spirochaetaceae bacterium]